jgi:hypothetical protein
MQMASKDKDFRYMACSDFQAELAKDTFRAEGETEKRLIANVLQLLEDPSGDISGLAVKWCAAACSPLASHMKRDPFWTGGKRCLPRTATDLNLSAKTK